MPTRAAAAAAAAVLLPLLGLAAACEQKLETGYVPRPLNSSEADRRSYYAPAFSPDSHPDKDSSSGPAFNFAR